jgi:hypothetical protein
MAVEIAFLSVVLRKVAIAQLGPEHVATLQALIPLETGLVPGGRQSRGDHVHVPRGHEPGQQMSRLNGKLQKGGHAALDNPSHAERPRGPATEQDATVPRIHGSHAQDPT